MTTPTKALDERPLLTASHIRKAYPGVLALDAVSLDLYGGEVHALVGENGAGKSTLIKILSGAVRPDGGDLLMGGVAMSFNSPVQARRSGVATIYQEGSLVGELTVEENLFLGQELNHPRMRFFTDRARMAKRARSALDEIAPQIDISTKVRDLPADQRQLVEIGRALLASMRLLILDEPTSSLNDREIERLFDVVERLKGKGVGVVYVTHKLAEVQQISDKVTVLRDGCLVATRRTDEVEIPDLIRMMIGRDLSEWFPAVKSGSVPQEALRLRGLSRPPAFDDVDLVVRKGEIVGLAGLEGSGQSELLRAVVGAEVASVGTIELFGETVRIDSPVDTVRLGVAYIPGDRQRDGVIPALSVRTNLALSALRIIGRNGFIRPRDEEELYGSIKEQLDIRARDSRTAIRELSGGNQQKVILGRAIAARARLFVLDEPTRGVDVGAKSHIYQLVRDLVDQEAGVLLFSSELEEVLGLCDVVYVMRTGKVVARLTRAEASEEKIAKLAFGDDPVPRSA
ncbi:MAG: rhamnose transport system ATP-binding protein [Actinomycetota bacterium]|jgi:ribose transport system ATP-binding protein|nr:rhamnose transport system ATP-binding protein [Actinomycetota bacterium]